MDSLLVKILLFRLKQCRRILKKVGFVRTILLAIIVVSYLIFEVPVLISGNSISAVLVYPLIILPIHLLRRDQVFLRKLDLQKKVILAGEYHSLVFPFSLFIIYYQQWLVIFLGHLLITIILLLPSVRVEKRYRGNNRFIKLIPFKLFEWRSYFRRRRLFLPVAFALTASLSPNAIAMAVAMLIVASSLSEAFTHLETKELIDAYSGNPNFLRSKLKDHSVFIHVLFLPLYLLFLLFHFEFWYIFVLLLIIIECSVCFCILYKYSWFGITESVIYNQIPFAIFFISTILFFPIGLTILYLYWKKAANALPDYAKT